MESTLAKLMIKSMYTTGPSMQADSMALESSQSTVARFLKVVSSKAGPKAKAVSFVMRVFSRGTLLRIESKDKESFLFMRNQDKI